MHFLLQGPVMILASCSTSVVITAVSPVLLLYDYTFLYATE